MSSTEPAAMAGTRTVTAFFDTSDHASAARADLIAAGIPENDITLVGSDSAHAATAEHPLGFWESLANFFMPDDDRYGYAEGLRRGGFALSVRAGDVLYDKALDVLDRDGAVDFDERELLWKGEGWAPPAGGVDAVVADAAYKPADAGTAGFGGSYAGEDGLASTLAATPPAPETAPVVPPAPAATGGPVTYADPGSPAADGSADIVEGRPGDGDNLFGRRDLTHGRSRVRSYIVEGDDRSGA